MHQEYQATIRLSVSGKEKPALDKIKDYLTRIVLLDIDEQDSGDFLVDAVEIDWNSLKEKKHVKADDA